MSLWHQTFFSFFCCSNHRNNSFVINIGCIANIADNNIVLSAKINTFIGCNRWLDNDARLSVYIVRTAISSSAF